MKISLCALSFGLILSAGVVSAQTAPQSQTPPPPVNPTTPANQVGDGGQSKSGTPATPSTTSPSTTGGVAGAAGASTAQTPDTQNSSSGVSAMSDSDLESQIQNALSKEPTLSGNSAHVNVTGDTIVLGGTVGTNKEKITATRIVQSYAGSKKLDNKLTISARGDKSSSDSSKETAPTSKPPQQ